MKYFRVEIFTFFFNRSLMTFSIQQLLINMTLSIQRLQIWLNFVGNQRQLRVELPNDTIAIARG